MKLPLTISARCVRLASDVAPGRETPTRFADSELSEVLSIQRLTAVLVNNGGRATWFGFCDEMLRRRVNFLAPSRRNASAQLREWIERSTPGNSAVVQRGCC